MASLKRKYKQVCTAALSQWPMKHQELFLDNVIKDRNLSWKFGKSQRGREPPPKVTANAWECHSENLYQAKPGDDNILVTEPHANHD